MNKGSATTIIIVSVGVFLVIGMLGYIFLAKPHASQNSSSASVPVTALVTTKDFAPSLPANQKTTILIQTSDSSEVKYIVPTNQIETFIESLPEGYHVVSKSP